MEDLTGKRILDKYDIKQALGTGGMAVVYQAFDRTRNHEVALKFIKPEVSNHPRFRETLLVEADHLKALTHNNIVRLLELEYDRGMYFLVMNFIDGETLKDYLKRQPQPTIEDVVQIVQQMGSALHYIHAKNVIHQDIKPANIIIDKAETVYVTDFGIAEMTGQHRSLSGTGTAPYMAPEQIMAEPITSRTDIYAFGLVVYEMLAGQRVFRGRDTDDIQRQQQNSPPPPISTHRPDLSPQLDAVLAQALSPDPTRRQSSALQLTNAVINALQGEPEPVVAPQPPPSRKRRPGLLTYVMLLILAGAIGGVFFVVFGVGESTEPEDPTALSAALDATSTRIPSPTLFITSTRADVDTAETDAPAEPTTTPITAADTADEEEEATVPPTRFPTRELTTDAATSTLVPSDTPTATDTPRPSRTPRPTPFSVRVTVRTGEGGAGWNVRSSPDDNGRLVGSLLPGTNIRAVGRDRSRDWLLIEWEGDEVWLFHSAVSISSRNLDRLPIEAP